MACVYAHIFPNKKLYIGLTKLDDPVNRWGKNGKGYQSQSLMWKSIQKYGWDNIIHIVLFTYIDIALAQEFEKYLIKKYSTNDSKFGYNIAEGGDTNAGYHHSEEYKQLLRERMTGKYVGEKNPSYGIEKSEDTKRKISNSLKGRTQSEESNLKRSNSLKGHIVTEETRLKISKANKNRILTYEQRLHISESHKGLNVGKEGYWKGKQQTEETRKKRSESLKGRTKSPETIEKLRMSCKGKKHGPMSEEQKLKISMALKGKPKKRETQ